MRPYSDTRPTFPTVGHATGVPPCGATNSGILGVRVCMRLADADAHALAGRPMR